MKHKVKDMKVRQLQLMGKENVTRAHHRMDQVISPENADSKMASVGEMKKYIENLGGKIEREYETSSMERRLEALETVEETESAKAARSLAVKILPQKMWKLCKLGCRRRAYLLSFFFIDNLTSRRGNDKMKRIDTSKITFWGLAFLLLIFVEATFFHNGNIVFVLLGAGLVYYGIAQALKMDYFY